MKLDDRTIRQWSSYAPPAAAHSVDLATKETAAAHSTELLARRERFLVADGQTATLLEQEALLGTNDLVEWNFLARCMCVSLPVCRIVVARPTGTLRATGFLIAPGIVLTNHHVLPNEDFAGSASIEFGYRYNIAGQIGTIEAFDLAPGKFYVSDEALDFAAVAVKPAARSGRSDIARFSYLRLHAEAGKVAKGDFVTIIQHPDGEPLRIALRENEVIDADLAKPVIWYRADTAHGSSGAPVFNDSFQVAALHSSGRIQRNDRGEYALRAGGFATSLEGLRDSDVIWEANVGVRVSRIAPALIKLAAAKFPAVAPAISAAMAGGDVLSAAIDQARDGAPGANELPAGREVRNAGDLSLTTAAPRGANSRELILPLQLRVSLESPAGGAGVRTPLTGIGDSLEKFTMQVPVIFDGLDSRTGYRPDFLKLKGGKKIALPKLTALGKTVAAPLTGTSKHELKYHKFSVVVHKERRMALFTAANVDWSDAAKKIDGKKPTRQELTGLADMVIEQWVLDPRIAPGHQLPDRFYTDDRGAFDKGHLVRREDVCWGSSFADIQKANGDTYHVTNCTPQIEGFNRSGSGEENWGDFENEVARQAKAEQLILFSGPVLETQDRWFRGLDDNGSVRIQVPRRFWKIVVARGATGLPEAFGFILAQDVIAITEVEFVVSKTWKPHKAKIAALQTLLRGWVDLSALIAFEK